MIFSYTLYARGSASWYACTTLQVVVLCSFLVLVFFVNDTHSDFPRNKKADNAGFSITRIGGPSKTMGTKQCVNTRIIRRCLAYTQLYPFESFEGFRYS